MPRPEFFGRSPELLRLPREAACPTAGGYCRLRCGGRAQTSNAAAGGWLQQLDGPMGFADYAYVLEDTGDKDRPYRVQELESGHIWWYQAESLESVAEAQVPERLRQHPTPDDGDYVTLVPGYKAFSDAGRGPLSLARTESAFGMVVLASGDRLRVRACHPTGERAEWWYDVGAVRKVHISYVPEHLRAPLRPGWGDYCVLTSEHSCYGDASEGPLDEGNLGVVVGVDHLPDTQGGLSATHRRYCVRACHNGLMHRYHEGAVHPVVVQLLHDEKIPPDTPGRLDKLLMTLSLLEAPAAVGGGSSAGGGEEVCRSLVHAAAPGGASLDELSCQAVVPGRRYWLKAQLFCKDDDLMLASFKPTSWQLYSPCGLPGQYRPLRQVDPADWTAAAAAAAVQQQEAPPCVTSAASQHQQHLCPELLSLQACRAATRHMQWGEAVGGQGSRAVEAWRSRSSGVEGAVGRLAAAAHGPGPWYCPYEDCLLGVWEWDSAETPLVVTPGGITRVQFAWEVSFGDLRSRATSTTEVTLQTTSSVADISTALAAAAAAASRQQQQQPLPTVMFRDLLRPGYSPSSPQGGQTPDPGQEPGRDGGDSSSDDSGSDGGSDGAGDGAGDAGSDAVDSSSQQGADEGEEEEEEGPGDEEEGNEGQEQEGEGEREEHGQEGGEAGGECPPAAAVCAAAGGLAAAAAAAVAASNLDLQQQQEGSNSIHLVDSLQDTCMAAAATNSSSSSSHNGAPQQQQQQEEACAAAAPQLPEIVAYPSAEWSFPLLHTANSSGSPGGVSEGVFPSTTDAGQHAAASSAPTTPMAGAGSAGTSSSGRRLSRSSSDDTPCSSNSGADKGMAAAAAAAAVAGAAAAGVVSDKEVPSPAAAHAPAAAMASAPAVSGAVDAAAAAAAPPDGGKAVSSVMDQQPHSSQAAAEPVTPAAADRDAPAAARPAAAASSSSSSTGTAPQRATPPAAVTAAPEVRRRPFPPVLPVLGPSSISSRDSVSSEHSSSTRPRTSSSSRAVPAGGGSRSARPGSSSSSSSRRASSPHPRRSSSSGTATTAAHRPSSTSSTSSGHTSRQSGGSTAAVTAAASSSSTPTSRSSSRSATPRGSPAATPTAAAMPTVAATPTAATTPTAGRQQQQQQPLGPGVSSISEVMAQLERQAEAREPMWTQGTEAAAEFASVAYDAAVEWHQHWRRPGRM